MTSVGAAWFTRAPVLAVACGLAAWYFSVQGAEFRTGYAFTDLGIPLYALTFMAPLLAGWAAYAAGALDPLLDRPGRGTVSLMRVAALLAVGAASAVAAALSVIAIVVRPAITGQLVLRGVLPFTAGAVLAAAIGWCFGFAFSRFLSMPAAAATAWIWFCLPQATTWTGGRASNVTTTFVVCCTRLQEPSDLAVVLPLTTAAVVLLASAGSLHARLRSGTGHRVRVVVLALTAPVIAVVPAGLVPQSPDDVVSQPRQGRTRCAVVEETRVCVWPEAASGLDDLGRAAAAMGAVAAAAGLSVPTVWSERAADGGPTVEWNPETPPTLRASVVASALVQWWECDRADAEDLTAALAQATRGHALRTTTLRTIEERCRAAGL